MDFAAAAAKSIAGHGYVRPKWTIEIFSFLNKNKMIANQIFRDKIYLEMIRNPFKNLNVHH